MNHKIGFLSLENRIIIPSLCQYSANVEKYRLASCSYWQYIKSGTDFLIIKATAVSLKRQTSPHCVELLPEEAKQAKNELDFYIRR